MRKVLLIIKREYLTRVRAKGFMIGTVIVPLIGVGSILLVVFLVGHTATQTSRIVILDNSGQLGAAIVRGLDGKLADGRPQFTVEEIVSRPASPDALQQDLRARINSEKLDAYLWIPQGLDESFELHMRNPTISVSSARYRAPWIRR
jgi:ABC-type Na+ efflux pump permease subunit